MQSRRMLEEIARDHRSGATELTRRAGEALLRFLEEQTGSPSALVEELARFAERLTEAQPAMASLRNVARRALGALQERGDLAAVKEAVQEFLQALERSPARIAERAVPLLPPGSRILTVSYSATVLEVLARAHREGRGIAVVCPESRPLCEGLRLARELASHGIPTEICVDALAPALTEECDLVVVGGDALAPEGLLNKCGTLPLALAAHRTHTPFLVAISSLKFLPRFERSWIREMPPEEVLDEPFPSVRVRNLYFDLTPWEYITHTVTESGALTAEEVRRRLSP